MVRISDVVHASVFAACIGGGAAVLHFMHRSALQGLGYGLVAWVLLILLYMVVRAQLGPHEAVKAPVVVDDDTAFEVEDGKNDTVRA